MTTDALSTRAPADERLNLTASLPFVLAHVLGIGLAIYTGVTWKGVLLCLGSYYLRMFGVTAGYHRYFAHRSFKTSRWFQFVLAWLAQTSAQKGVLWWAGHHRHHHRYSDQEEDIHSPARKGFFWAHVGWILSYKYDGSNNHPAIKDFEKYPELRWLNRNYLVPPLSALALLFIFGGLEVGVWAGLLPTVFLWHGTFSINSLMHIIGRRRYLTTDMSRNSMVLALITCGEGWHNNHHYHQNTANQGWFWWEIDLTYYVLKMLSWVGLVWDLRTPSPGTKYAFQKYSDADRARLEEESRWGMFLPQPGKPAEAPQPSAVTGPAQPLIPAG